MNLTAIGAHIALLRRSRGLTQKELANRLGVSTQAVSKWENAETLPDAGILLPLAEVLHTTADALLSTGKLAVLLADSAARLYAVEPSVHMRRILSARTADFPSVQVISATAEATGLPDHSVDAITVAEAYHWFDNERTRAEFRRILKPRSGSPTGSQVFLLWNHFYENDYDVEMRAIQQGHRTYPRPKQRTGQERADDLFGPGCWERFTFDNSLHQTFQQFYGGMSSASYAPEDGTVAGKAFRETVQALFDKYAVHGRIVTHVETVCYAGHLK